MCLFAKPLFSQGILQNDVGAKANVPAIMHKVNDYQMKHPSNDPLIASGYEARCEGSRGWGPVGVSRLQKRR